MNNDQPVVSGVLTPVRAAVLYMLLLLQPPGLAHICAEARSFGGGGQGGCSAGGTCGAMQRDADTTGKKAPCSTWQHSTADLPPNCSFNTFSCATGSSLT